MNALLPTLPSMHSFEKLDIHQNCFYVVFYTVLLNEPL
jgi:hypothetical protein